MNWNEVIERLGYPIAISLILLSMGWRVSRWFGVQIIVPLRDAHVNFLNTMSSQQIRLADSSEQQVLTSQKVDATLAKLADAQESHTKETAYIRRLLEDAANNSRKAN